MRFAWFILIYCFLVKANADNKTSINELTNKTESIDLTELNKQNLTKSTDKSSFKKQIKINKDDILSALPSTASLTTLPIRADVVHKSIPIQRGIIKSRPLAGVKSSNYQFSRQVKDIKQSFEELQTERSTVIASTRPAPLSTLENNNRENSADKRNLYSTSNQLENKSTTPSLPNLGTTKLDTETSDQLVRRSSLGKTNLKSGKTNEHRIGLGIKGPVNSNKNLFGKDDQYEHQQEKDQRLEDPKYNPQNNQQQINDDQQQARQLIPSDEQFPNNNRDICDFCLYEGEGNFTSYGYPLPYKNNLNCSYRVQRVDEFETCALEIYFHEFDVPIEPQSTSQLITSNKNSVIEETASNECKGDYLEIQGRRFCGNGWMNKMETIPFAPEQTELSFKFKSDQRGSGKGFWLEVRRKLGSCHGRIPPIKKCEKRYSEMKFTITNPQYPSSYSNNINCAYFIRKATPDVCGLEMRFKHFDVEFDNNCNYDFFEIDGEKLCGTMEQDTIKRIKFSPEVDQKQFNFQSDKEVGRTGFKIDITQLTNCDSLFDDHDELKLEQLPPPPSCSVCTSDTNGTLVSYGYSYGNYRNNLHCSYTIDRKNDQYCGIQLYFEDFSVAPSPNCAEDYLLIGEEKYCGTVLHSTRKSIPFRLNNSKDGTKSTVVYQHDTSMTMPSTNTSIQMIFHTNQVQTAKGFKIKFQQIKCNINSNDDESNSRIKIQSNIVPDMNDNDIARYSANRDHDRTNNLDQSSGYSPTTPMPPVHCEHHFNSKYFTLISPNTTSTDSGEISANGHQVLAYPNNLACDFRITQNSSQVCYLELTFRKFDVEASAQCQFDYLEINNVRLCGTLQRQTTRTYIFNTMNKVVRFRTDGSTSRSGFIIDVEQLECNGDAIIRPNLPMLNNNIDNNLENRKTNLNNRPQMMHNLDISGGLKKDNNQMMNNNTMNDLCAKMYTEDEFEVFSPNYPLNYPLNSFCVYTVQRSSPSVCKFEINFMQFNIENSKAGICTADYLDIMGVKVCGTLGSNTKKQFPFPMDRNDVRIVFSANALRSENDLGFYLRFKQIHCSSNNEIMNNQISNNPLPPYIQQEQPNDYPTNPLFLDSTLSGNCNEMHAETIFQLKSPNFPSNYVRNLNCAYKIIKNKPEICQLEVNVIEFNVQPAINSGQTMSIIQAQECGQEYVDFNGNQICGRISPRTVRFFPFSGSEFIIKFKSGYTDLDSSSSNTDRAFLLQVRQRECPYLMPNQQMPTDEQHMTNNQIMTGNTKTGKTPLVISNNFEKKKQIEVCDQQFDTKEFEIKYAVQTSTKDGSMNTENRTHNCIYTIRKIENSVCALGFIFNEFLINDMGIDSNCDMDYFKVTDTEKLCSNLPFQMIKKIPFNEDTKVLQLHLSSSNPLSQKRVYIKVVQINCSTNENSITPNPNLNQQVIAQLPSINPTLHSPGPINQSPSQQVPEMYNNNNNNQTTDSFSRPNMNQIDYMHQLPPPSICELCYTELSGDIISYNYPAAYPRGLNCNYKITGQPGFCGVYLRFYVFTINNADTRSASTPCVDDYLELNSVKYCGKQLENVKKILAFDSNPKELSFRFVSKKHTIGNGFKLGYMQIPCYLTPGQESILTAMMTDTPINGGTSSGINQAAASPKFSLPSNNNNGGSQSKTSDSFSQENQVQENEMTNGDYQAFYSSGDPNPITQQHQPQIPQSTKSLSSNSSSNSTKDSMISNDLSQASSVHNIPRLPCDQAIYDRFFEIHSPNYPFSYPSNSDCLYSVRRLSSSICKLRLYFADFELENDHNYKLIKDNHSLQRNLLHQTDEGCNEDFLEINEKLRFCGAQLNNTLRDFDFTSYKFPLRFRSNEEGSSKGFVIRGEQIQCIPNSVMFSFPDKQPGNQLQSSDSNLSTFKLNGNNKITGLDQIGFYTLPPVKHNSTSYSSSSSAVFRSPVQTSTTNSSSSSYQSSSTSQSQSLNSNDSLAFLSPNSNYQLTPLNQPQPSIKWNIPNSAPYMISIKGQQVSINGEHPNTYYFTNNDTQSSIPKNAANFNQFNQKLSTSINNISNNNQILNDPQQPIASDSQTHHHTSSSTSQYNCNQIISDPIFELTSPYYPYRYDSNTRCLITIQKYKRNVCHLDLVFIKFDLGSSHDCDHYTDYLQINGERFCGHYYHNRSLHFSMPDDITRAVKVRTFRFDGPTLAMSFAGELGTGYGFYLRGRQVECAVVGKDFVGRILPITDPHDHENLHPLVDNHPDHYHSNENSHEDHSGEQNDHHLAPINPTTHHHSNDHHTNDHHLTPINPPHHHHLPAEINHHHTPHHLDKPPYHYHPDHYYRLLHKDNITLDHSPKANHTVRYNLDHKHLNQNTTTNTFNYPPHVDLHHQINNYQSNKNEHTNHTTNNLTKHHNLANHYNTHNFHTNNQANHETKYNVSNYLIDSNKLVGVPRSLTSLSHCDQIFSSNHIQIQSPNHPSNYPNNILCRYVIQRPNNQTCGIDLTFVNFNLEEEDRCSKDYFEIDGSRICGTLPPYHQRRYYYFSGEAEKILTFRTDLFISHSGFSIVGQQITNCNSYSSRTDNSPIKCDVQTDSVKGELISRNYPALYDHNMQCTYKIRAADQRFCRLSLRIRDFDIRSNANCDDDYLYIDKWKIV